MRLSLEEQPVTPTSAHAEGRLSARPHTTFEGTGVTGLHKSGLGRRRDGLVYVPESYDPSRPAPLALLLHGAGGNAENQLQSARAFADALGIILVAPDSRGPTWDIIHEGLGPDVAFIDQTLSMVFAQYAIDPQRIAIGGFSDGASYALTIGLSNGDLFTDVLAFSPGFLSPQTIEGMPRVFISHGTKDSVLPINACSRRFTPGLKRAGYEVDYREFDGPHTVPSDTAREAFTHFARGAKH